MLSHHHSLCTWSERSTQWFSVGGALGKDFHLGSLHSRGSILLYKGIPRQPRLVWPPLSENRCVLVCRFVMIQNPQLSSMCSSFRCHLIRDWSTSKSDSQPHGRDPGECHQGFSEGLKRRIKESITGYVSKSLFFY